MKSKLLFTTILILALAIAQPVSAQRFLDKLGKKLKNKVEEVEKKVEKKVDDKVDEKVDEKVDNTLDKAFEDDDNPSKKSQEARDQERLHKIMEGIGMSGEPVPIADEYLFDTKIQMHIESYKGNGDLDNEGDFITYINPGNKNFAYEFISGDFGKKGKGTFIMDFKNKTMIILSDDKGKKTGIVYGMDLNLDQSWDEAYKNLDEEDVKNINMNPYLKKTGRTKSISGYKCTEYKYDNPEENVESSFWVSKDADFKTRDYMSAIFKSAAYSRGMPWGFIMESEAINTETKERSIMKVTELDDSANKEFDLGTYQVTNLGSMKIPDMPEE